MICKETEKIIDNLLRLKTDNGTNNKIASYQYNDWKTKKANETKCVNLIGAIMDDYQDKTQNKVASVSAAKKIGEVAELQSYLKL